VRRSRKRRPPQAPPSARAPERSRISIGATLAVAARTYSDQARLLVPAALVLFAPLSLLGVLVGDVEGAPEEPDVLTGVLLSAEAIVQFAALALGEVFFMGLAVAAVSESRTGERRPKLIALARELPWGRLVVADLIITLGTALGLLLLIVPGIVFFAWFALAAPLIEIEELRLGSAFRRSRRLVRGHFLSVLLLLGGSYAGSSVLAAVAEEGELLPFEHSLLGDFVTVLAADVLLTPIVAVIAAVLAYELIRLDGGSASRES
jgi:hypothetical protein